MNRCDEYQLQIDLFVEQGGEAPRDLEDHLHACSTCREYEGSLKALVETLDSVRFPNPPPGLTDEVMLFIREHEPQPFLQSVRLNIVSETWRALVELFPRFEIPILLRQEAWPTAIATLAVVWGVFIAPSVEAGKVQKMLNSPLIYEVDRYAEEIRTKSEEAAGTVISLAAGMLRKAYPMEASSPQDRLERARPYLEE